MLRILASIAPSTAASRSASSNTRNGALPPSSMRGAQHLVGALLEQLPADLGRAGERQLAGPAVADQRLHHAARVRGGDHVEHAVRQAGLLRGSAASASIDSGVCSAGLTTIVQPAATAGPILRVPIAIGKFHGVISRHGPDRLPHHEEAAAAVRRDGVAALDAHGLLGEPAEELGRVGDLARATRRSGLPISSVISSARSSCRASEQVVGPAQDLAALPRRGRGPVRPAPATAASRAAMPSAGVASATSQSTCPVAGSSTAKVAPGRSRPPLAADEEPLVGDGARPTCLLRVERRSVAST